MVKVTFTNKQGARETVGFPSRAIAESYARGVKSPVLTEDGVVATPVAVKVVAAATAEDTRRATNAFYKAVNNGEKYQTEAVRVANERREIAEAREHEAEQMAEHFAECRYAGRSHQEGFEDWDARQGRAG
jgi:hypothetical protein